MDDDRGLSFGDKPATAVTADFANSRAYVIGINAYQNGIPQLRTAVADAEKLGELLQASHGYVVQSFPRDGAATLANLRRLLHQKMPEEVGPNDRVLLYFAGHGIAFDGDDGPEGYLVPEDANREDRSSFLSMTELNDALAQLPCQHLLLLLDCCFAGAFRWSSTRDLSPLPSVIHRERYERYIKDPAWQVLTSAAHDQKALDVLSGSVIGERVETSNHSPFASALFQALKGDADLIPRDGGDGVMTATELYLYLRECVETATEERKTRQTPGLWPLKKHDKGEFILLTPGREVNLPPAPELNYENNPYRGLQSFEEEHSHLFFGRGDIIEELHCLVSANPLTVVLGASGTGKSSVVKAGLLPMLKNAMEDDWQILPVIRPGKSPLATLSNLTLPGEDPNGGQAERLAQFRFDENAFAERIKAWAAAQPPTSRLLLIVDQLEELVTLCCDDRERKQFIALLASALDAVPERFRLVVTIRSDFEPQFSDCELKALWMACRYVVPPMSTDALREAIEGPASERVIYFQPSDLVDRLIDEVIQTPGAMPLLSITLSELYIRYLERRGDDRCLTMDDYKQFGGVAGLLRSRATDFYDSLDAPHQATMQRIMLRMVSALGSELARRRVPIAELAYSSDDENTRVSTLVSQLSEGRLIVQGKEVGGDPYVEPAHDELVRGWDKLLEWTRNEQEQLTLRRLVTPAANDWKKGAGGLWHFNPRLALLRQQLPRPESYEAPTHDYGWLNATEAEFVAASVERRQNTFGSIIGSVAAAFIALSLLTWYAFAAQRRAVENEATALREKRAALIQLGNAEWERAVGVRDVDHDDVHAAHLFANSASAFASAEAPRRAANSLTAMNDGVIASFPHPRPVFDALLNTDGSRILTCCEDESVRLWDPERHELVRAFKHDDCTVDGAAFIGNRSQVFTWCQRGTVFFWDPTQIKPIGRIDTGRRLRRASVTGNGALIITLDEFNQLRLWKPWDAEPTTCFDSVVDFVLDRAGTLLLFWDSSRTVQLWDLTQDKIVKPLTHDEPIKGAKFNHDDSRILFWTEENSAWLWDPARDVAEKEFPHPSRIEGAVFSGDGTRLLIWSNDKTMQLWDVGQPKEVGEFKHPYGGVVHALLNRDGSRFLTWGFDGNGVFWDAEQTTPLRTFLHERTTRQRGVIEPSSFNGALFNNDESLVLTWSSDAPARIWEFTQNDPVKTLGHISGNAVDGALFSEDGARVLTWSFDGMVRLWDITQDDPVRTLQHPFRSGSISRSSISTRSLTWGGGFERSAWLWDTAQAEPLNHFDHENVVDSASFSSDESRVLSWTRDGKAWLWDTKNKLEPLLNTFDHEAAITGALINRGGSRVLTWSRGGKPRLWDLVHDRPPRILEHEVIFAQFTRDGSRVLTWSYDGGGMLWDPAQVKPVRKWRHEAKRTANGVTKKLLLSNDGSHFVTLSFDGPAYLWDLAKCEPVREYNHTTSVSGALFSEDGSRLLTWSYDGIAKLWDTATRTLRETATEVPLREYRHTLPSANGEPTGIWGARFNHDASRLLTWSDDATVRVWSDRKDDPWRTFPHAKAVHGASFNGDESRVLTWCDDGTTRLWDINQNEPIKTFESNANQAVKHAMFNFDESQILTWNNDGSISIWAVPLFDEVKPDDADAIKLDHEVRSAATIAEGGAYRLLTLDEWLRKQKQLSAK